MTADWSWITRRLAVGAALNNIDDIEEINKQGITHVIDCRDDFNGGQMLGHTNVSYLWLPVEDDLLPKSSTWFDAGIVFASTAFGQRNARVLCSCMTGMNSSPSMVYAILRAIIGLSNNTAETLIRAARPDVTIAYRNDADRAIVELGWVPA